MFVTEDSTKTILSRLIAGSVLVLAVVIACSQTAKQPCPLPAYTWVPQEMEWSYAVGLSESMVCTQGA